MKHLLITIAAVVLVRTIFAGPIHEAAKYGDLAGVQAELDKGVDVDLKDESGRTSLYHAADVSDIAWLIEKDILEEKIKVAELLITKGADVTVKDSTGDTPLHETILYSSFNKGIAELLIVEGADLNALDEREYTPLHFAASEGHKVIVELLITKGADVNVKSNVRGVNTNKTPLDWAIEENHTEIADLLRKHGDKTGEELKAEATK